MIPILYNADEQLYDSWGIGPLSEISNPKVIEEGNGLFYFTFDYPASSEMYKHLKNQNKVVADASPELKNQVFVITRVTKPLRGIVSVYAEHISLYVTKNAGFSNKVNYNGDARDALRAWQGALITEEEVYVSSDITMTSTGTWELDKVQHARKVLGGVEGSILDVYGGEYRFDNLHISLMKSRGENRGVEINWGKNLIDLVDEEDLNRVNTAIEPFAKLYVSEEDKQLMTEDEKRVAEETILWLPEQILYSKYSAMYHYQRVALIDLTNENVTSIDDLRAKADAYMDRNNFGRPKIDTKISHVDLSKTIEYQDIAEFEAIDLFDTVTVNVEKYGITGLTAKVIEVDYNPLLERYNEIRIGNTLSTRFQENVGSVKQIEASQAERLAKIEREIIITQEIAGGGALIFRTEAGSSVTPIANNVGDTWYKKLGDGKTQILVWNGIEWESILNLEELEYNIESAQSAAQTAIEEAEKATTEAVKAIQNTETAFSRLEGIDDVVFDIESRLDPTMPDSLAYQVARHTSTIAEQGGSLETLRGDFDGLEIGGRNLILDSDRVTEIISLGEQNQATRSAYTMSEHFNYILPEQKLISLAVSFKWRVTTPEGVHPTGRIVLQNNTGGQWITPTPGLEIDKTEGVFTTGHTREFIPFDKIDIRIDNVPIDSVVEIWDIKLEKGNKATDWTPAPEDLATSKEFNDYKQTSEGYFQRIQSIETDLKSGLTYTKIHDIKNTADRAESTLAQLTDGDVTAYNQKISTAIGDIQTIRRDFDSLEIHERNLLLDSKPNVTNSDYLIYEFPLSEEGKKLEQGEEVTAILKGKPGEGKSSFRLFNSGGVIGGFHLVEQNRIGEDLYRRTFKWRWIENQFSVYVYVSPQEVASTSTIEWIKLVRGNFTSADWSPAPEDMATSQELTTQISTLAGRINVQIVSNADGTKSMMDMTSNQLLYNIDGGKIQVTKDKFYMDQTLIVPIIQTTKLSATQIESGTLDANKANIINLNVANLVGENADLVRGSFNAINSSINIDGTALTTKGNWGDIKLSNRGLTIHDNVTSTRREMGVLYGLFRNEDDPLNNTTMLGTGLFASMGYKLNLGIRNPAENVNLSVISLDQSEDGRFALQMNVFGDILARYDLKMFGGMLTGAANAGYTVTEANGGTCIEFANGWKIQFWRSSYQTFSSGWTSWTFPKRFISLPRIVLAQAVRDDENMTPCNAYGFNYHACNIRIQEKTLSWTIVAVAIGN